MIAGIYKMDIIIKNRIYNYSNSLIEPEKLEVEIILIDEKTIRIWWYICSTMLTVSRWKC